MQVCLYRNESIMSGTNQRGKPRNPPATPVGVWIDENMKRRGIQSIRELAEIAGVSQPRITQIRKGDNASRDFLERLAHALSPKDADERTFRALLSTGLAAAGFATDDYDDHEVIEYLRGQPPSLQDKALRMLKAAFDEDDDADNSGNIGKRAE